MLCHRTPLGDMTFLSMVINLRLQVLRDIETENPTKIRRTVLELMKQSSHKAKALDMKCKNITYSPAKDKSNNVSIS